MINLIGKYECTADAKGRVMLPSAFKKQLANVLADGFVIKQSVFDKCLELYPMQEWKNVEKKISKLNPFVKKNKLWIRKFKDGIKLVELDDAGRFLIPKDLLNYASITKDIVMLASSNVIEIWDKTAYEKSMQEADVDFEALTEDVMSDIDFSRDE